MWGFEGVDLFGGVRYAWSEGPTGRGEMELVRGWGGSYARIGVAGAAA